MERRRGLGDPASLVRAIDDAEFCRLDWDCAHDGVTAQSSEVPLHKSLTT